MERKKLLVLGFLTFFSSGASSFSPSLEELQPFLNDLSQKRSAPEIAEKLKLFLEKANDIALKTITSSGSPIEKEKLEEFKDDFQAHLYDELLDFYTPINTD